MKKLVTLSVLVMGITFIWVQGNAKDETFTEALEWFVYEVFAKAVFFSFTINVGEIDVDIPTSPTLRKTSKGTGQVRHTCGQTVRH